MQSLKMRESLAFDGDFEAAAFAELPPLVFAPGSL